MSEMVGDLGGETVQSQRGSGGKGDGATADAVCEGDPYEMGLTQGTIFR